MKKILIIDDQKDNLVSANALLKSYISDCEVFFASAGQEGIDIAIEKQPDTILLDIIMPKMDGYETCKKLKENESTKHIPVIMLTAIKTDVESRVKGLNVGADAFLSKPIEPSELSAQVSVMLRIKEAEDSLRAEKDLLDEKVKERTLELKESEGKYRTMVDDVLDTSAVGIFILDSNFKVVWINSSTEKYFGINRDDVIGKDKRKLIQSKIKNIFDDPDTFLKKIFNAYDDNTYIENFDCHVMPDGNREERWLDHWSQPIVSGLYKGGRVEQYTDITESKHAEEKLLKNQYYLTKAQELGRMGSWELDVKKDVLTWTDENYEIFGVPLGTEMNSERFMDCVHPDDRDYVQRKWEAALNNEIYDVEHRLLVNDEVKWVREKADIEFDIEGKPVMAIGFTQDITERKMVAEDLKRKLNELQIFNDATVDREIRMLELKKEINDMLEKSGEEQKYQIPI